MGPLIKKETVQVELVMYKHIGAHICRRWEWIPTIT